MAKFDVIIIGGGAAGMIAAISAKRHNPKVSVAIIDRTFALGRKILIAGAGRCNVTNINLKDKIDTSYYGAPLPFIHSVFDQFGYKEIEEFFNDLGIELYVERKTNIGKVFPITNQAHTVTELMIDEIERLGVEVYLNTEAEHIQAIGYKKQNPHLNPLPEGEENNMTNPSPTGEGGSERSEEPGEGFKLRANKIDKAGNILETMNFECTKLIVSAGGKTYPALGSNGSMYPLLTYFGHSVIHPVPSALPLEAPSQLSHLLQGQKMEIEVTTIIDGKEIKTRTDDVMFTKYGLSGPAILNVSREVSIHFHRENKNNALIKLNFFPEKTKDEVKAIMEKRWSKRPDQSLEKSLYGLFPNKIAGALVRFTGISIPHLNPLPEGEEKKKYPSPTGEGASSKAEGLYEAGEGFIKAGDLTEAQKEKIIETLTNTRIKITGTRGWNEAEFTAGGITSDEIKPVTLESKLIPNLYICGEIIDVDGDVGGFNLSWSWASGFIAGMLKN
jgi:predicted flavoprotein YhiN